MVYEKCIYYISNGFKLGGLSPPRNKILAPPLAITLSNIAKGTVTLNDTDLLKSRAFSNENLLMTGDAIGMFRSSAEVDAYNKKVLASLNTNGSIANAYDSCVGDRLTSIREKVLNNVKTENN